MRFAIISSPRSGNTLLRKILSDILCIDSFAFHSPSNVEWKNLSERCIIQIHWEPNEDFVNCLLKNSFKIFTLCRNPADIFLSILHFCNHESDTSLWLMGKEGDETKIINKEPMSQAFRSYLCGERASSLLSLSLKWSKIPGVRVVKYEDIFENPQKFIGEIKSLADSPSAVLKEIVLKHTDTKSIPKTDNFHFWQGLPGNWKKLIDEETYSIIYKNFRDYFEAFGYGKYRGSFVNIQTAKKNWRKSAVKPEVLDEDSKFISNSQNLEDVMLWRVFAKLDKGFYIDVGANDPDKLSVSKSFYDQGWSGINIEPCKEWFDLIQEKRSRDINLNLAIDLKMGESSFYQIKGSGLSTLDKKIAMNHKANGLSVVHKIVQTDSLTNICRSHAQKHIHFLKIDVEGNELNVVKSIDLNIFRPWIIVIESTFPLSQKENHKQFDMHLVSCGYLFTYTDGINRFYVSEGKKELVKYFNSPPNLFDNFISADFFQLKKEAKNLAKLFSQSREREKKYAKMIESNHLEFSKLEKLYFQLEKKLKEKDQIDSEKDQYFSELELDHKKLEKLNLEKDSLFSNLEQRFLELEETASKKDEDFSKLEKRFFKIMKLRDLLEDKINSLNISLEATKENLYLSDLRKLELNEQFHDLEHEVQRLKKLLYGVGFSKHLYRSLAVIIGAENYRRKF